MILKCVSASLLRSGMDGISSSVLDISFPCFALLSALFASCYNLRKLPCGGCRLFPLLSLSLFRSCSCGVLLVHVFYGPYRHELAVRVLFGGHSFAHHTHDVTFLCLSLHLDGDLDAVARLMRPTPDLCTTLFIRTFGIFLCDHWGLGHAMGLGSTGRIGSVEHDSIRAPLAAARYLAMRFTTP